LGITQCRSPRKTEEIQEIRRKHRLIDILQKLNEQKDKVRPADMGLFHAYVEQCIEGSTARTLANYISSHSKAIKNSVTYDMVRVKSNHV
jgi:hypothetical protein